jgi:hypothetical protein
VLSSSKDLVRVKFVRHISIPFIVDICYIEIVGCFILIAHFSGSFEKM